MRRSALGKMNQGMPAIDALIPNSTELQPRKLKTLRRNAETRSSSGRSS